jgi:hypothetical protein
VAQVVHASELGARIGLVEVHRVVWVVGNGHESSVCAAPSAMCGDVGIEIRLMCAVRVC